MIWAGRGLIVLLLLGCSGSGQSPDDGGSDGVVAPDTADGSMEDGKGLDVEKDSSGPPPKTITVPEGACCISMGEEWIVWAQDGDLWGYDRFLDDAHVLVEDDFIQKDPVLDGTRVVWADNRNGTFDLFALDLETMETTAVVEAPDDQHSPSLSGDALVYVHQPLVMTEAGTINTALADIWMIDLSTELDAKPLVQDDAEQRYPDIRGSKVVWSDFRNDPERMYHDFQSVANNNGDVFGYDLDEGVEIVVTINPAKQLRPAVEGDTVVWLDWRHSVIGIEPLPKYDDFKVYAYSITNQVEMVLAGGMWKQPKLWRRPVLQDGLVAWIVEDRQNDVVVGTSVNVSSVSQALNGGPLEATRVVQVDGILTAIDMMAGSLSWIGDGQVGVASLNVLMEQVGQ